MPLPGGPQKGKNQMCHWCYPVVSARLIHSLTIEAEAARNYDACELKKKKKNLQQHCGRDESEFQLHTQSQQAYEFGTNWEEKLTNI